MIDYLLYFIEFVKEDVERRALYGLFQHHSNFPLHLVPLPPPPLDCKLYSERIAHNLHLGITKTIEIVTVVCVEGVEERIIIYGLAPSSVPEGMTVARENAMEVKRFSVNHYHSDGQL